MIRHISSFFLQIIGLSLVVALGHWALVYYTPLDLPRDYLFGMHMFIVLITIVAYTGTVIVWKMAFHNTGFAFLGSVFLKMMAAFFYLLPVLLEESDRKNQYILHFFAAYFIYLVFEVLKVVKLLKNKEDSPSK